MVCRVLACFDPQWPNLKSAVACSDSPNKKAPGIVRGFAGLERNVDQYFATTAAELNFQFSLAMTSAVSTLTLRVDEANVKGPASGNPIVATDPALKVCLPYQV
jgi:hypothetical protein